MSQMSFQMSHSIIDSLQQFSWVEIDKQIVLLNRFLLKSLLKHFIKGLVFHSAEWEKFRSKSMKWNLIPHNCILTVSSKEQNILETYNSDR